VTEAAALAPARVILVDVRAERLGVMRATLDASGLAAVIGAADTKRGVIEEVGRSSPDLVIVEIQMPVEEGLATIAVLRQHFPGLRIVVCTFHQDADTKRRARKDGADAYIGKPLDLAGLGALLRGFAATRRQPGLEAVAIHDFGRVPST
jgi:DNA-binding NarL/FixJ family response regulator